MWGYAENLCLRQRNGRGHQAWEGTAHRQATTLAVWATSI